MRTNHFVFDTNSLVSALLISSSVSRKALRKADESGLLTFSMDTLTELNEVLIRSKFDKYASLQERMEFIERLETRGKIIEVSSNFIDCRDLKDNKFLNLIYDVKAECLVTGDHDLLVLNPFHNIPIVSAAHFFNEFTIT